MKKQLDRYYKTIVWDDRIDLYDINPETGTRLNDKYLCSVKLFDDGIWFNGIKYPGITIKLRTAIDQYVASLPFSSENYNPMFKDGVREIYCIDDMLLSLGFKRGNNGEYYLTNGVMDERYSILVSGMGGKSEITARNGNTWVTDEWEHGNLDDAIRVVSGFIQPYLLVSAGVAISALSKMSIIASKANIHVQTGPLSVETAKMRDQLVPMLDEMLKELKK